jgi:hypothetical protein
MARPRGKKRTAAQAAATDSSKPKAAAGDSTKPEAAAAAKEPAARGRGKRAKAPPKPKAETEYFPEKRNLVSRLHDDLPGCVLRIVRFWYPRVVSVDWS